MATKSSKKSTTSKKSVAKAPKSAPRKKTIRESLDESEVLRFHMKIITILSIVVCVLVGALLLSILQ
ncbi:hypothetical protein IKG02_02010 [Candidatus Saccharibacteria bacterium]|nr:hypothetical protein [Candidatus Saccharibacteria bacterium]